jgi:hypothetical protein
MKLVVTFVVSLVALSATFAVETRAGVARIALRTNTEVGAAMIFLSDLVPTDAPDYVREEAARIPLGLAPQAGTARVLQRSHIASAIDHAGLPDDVFTVPERVIVRRAGRTPSLQDVWAAIERYLSTHPASAIRDLKPSDLRLAGGFSIPPESQIEVTRVTIDMPLHLAHLYLKINGMPESANPVCASVRLSSLPASDSSPIVNAKKSTHVTAKQTSSQPILVEPKTIARLHLHSSESDMMLDVRPLERGALDQTIRVRLTSSAKTLQARVIGANSLDASF